MWYLVLLKAKGSSVSVSFSSYPFALWVIAPQQCLLGQSMLLAESMSVTREVDWSKSMATKHISLT